jgi:hypothetical protein
LPLIFSLPSNFLPHTLISSHIQFDHVPVSLGSIVYTDTLYTELKKIPLLLNHIPVFFTLFPFSISFIRFLSCPFLFYLTSLLHFHSPPFRFHPHFLFFLLDLPLLFLLLLFFFFIFLFLLPLLSLSPPPPPPPE